MKYKSEMAKVKKYSHNLWIVINAFYWVSIIAAVLALAAAAVIKLMSDSYFTLTKSSIVHLGFSIDGLIKYSLNESTSLGINMKNIYFTIMIMTLVLLVLIIPVLKQLALILKTVEKDKPFEIENAKRISIIGFILMMAAFIIPAVEVFVANVMIDTLKIQYISTNYTINLTLILISLMMFILGGIFKYGSYLQHEYDETV